MKINADIYVKDVPGTLVSSLEPISTLGGNIVGVVHNREQIVSVDLHGMTSMYADMRVII